MSSSTAILTCWPLAAIWSLSTRLWEPNTNPLNVLRDLQRKIGALCRGYPATRTKRSSPSIAGEYPVSHSAYSSECSDYRLHARHLVSVHWWRRSGQTPPVSKVFHE